MKGTRIVSYTTSAPCDYEKLQYEKKSIHLVLGTDEKAAEGISFMHKGGRTRFGEAVRFPPPTKMTAEPFSSNTRMFVLK